MQLENKHLFVKKLEKGLKNYLNLTDTFIENKL
jgi:hypothetical protein